MLKVYTFAARDHTASTYYRLLLPFQTARDLGMKLRVVIDNDSAGIDPLRRWKEFSEADVIVMYQPVGDQVLHNIRQVKSFVPTKREDGWKYHPTVIVETDDNLFNVSPHNQAFKTLGIRDHEGNLIPPGHMIGEVREGERRLLWKDGEAGFDLTRNRHTIETYRLIVNMADAVFCSTPPVEECVKADAAPRRTKVFPNLVRFDHYEQVDVKRDPSRINIMWQGGASHYEDWLPLKQALSNITNKYPEVHWIIWGQLYHWVTELIPADRYTFKRWCPYSEYKLRLSMMNHDINLAPLSDNRFNRCRSAIKWYEGGVLKYPIPTLAQNTGPYKAEIEDGKTGLLFSDPAEFEQKLSTLIENQKLRLEIGQNAKDWLSDNRDAFKKVPRFIDYLENLRSEIEREVPHMPDEDWPEFEKRYFEQEAAREAEAEAAKANAPEATSQKA